MATLTQLATSLMYVWQEINVSLITGASYTPTSDTVQMAFVPQPSYGPPPDPVSGQFNAAIWGTGPGPTYWAGCLVGPGGTVQLAAGSYVIAVKVTDSPEIPVLWGWGLLVILAGAAKKRGAG